MPAYHPVKLALAKVTLDIPHQHEWSLGGRYPAEIRS